MNKTLILATVLALGFGFGPTLVQGDTKEEKKRAKEVKKSLKKLTAKVKKSMRAKAHDQTIDAVREIEKLNHPLAADFLLGLALAVQNGELYEVVHDAVGYLDDPSVAAHLVTRLKEQKKKKIMLAWQQKVVVADAFKGLTAEPVGEGLALCLLDKHPAVVRAALAIAGSKEDKRVIEGLIALLLRLDKQGGTLYFATRQALVNLTGEDFFSHEKWKAWWSGAKEGFSFEKKGDKTEAATVERKKEEIPMFFGTEVKSNRVLFVIDISGSMKMTDPPEGFDGEIADFEKTDPKKERQRIERAKSALAAVIKTLQPTQQFNIIRFSSSIDPWQRKANLVPATESNKTDALKYVEAMRESGGTETAQALKRAFTYADVDTIYFLSDGAPSAKAGNPGEQQLKYQEAEIKKIMDWLRLENRFRRVKIHAFGFDGPGAWHKKWGPRSPNLPMDMRWLQPFQNFMREISSATGGEFKGL